MANGSKKSLEKLLVGNMKDLYDAEHQILEALPKMSKAAGAKDLKKTLDQHLKTTNTQATRIEKAFKALGQEPSRKKCKGMEGLIKEVEQHMKEHKKNQDVLDAVIIAAAQKVEHYEISGYGTAKTYAEMLGHKEVARLLDQTLSEEYKTDKKLTGIAEGHINAETMQLKG